MILINRSRNISEEKLINNFVQKKLKSLEDFKLKSGIQIN